MKRAQPLDETARPARARWPWWVALLASVVGLGLSVVLAQLHFKTHTIPGFHSFCALDRTVNCDIVSRSRYSVFLGVPVAAWGIYAYGVMAIVSLWGLRSRKRLAAACGLALSLLYLALTVALGAISAFLLTAICILCLATYGVNLVFFVCMLWTARPDGLHATLGELPRILRDRPGRAFLVLALLGGAMLVLIAAHPNYWKATAQASRAQLAAPLLPHGIEPGGGHYLGAERPILTITEFSDYECPFCRQAHFRLRELVERFPDRLRLVHRHYPLDHNCNPTVTVRMHENACFAAAVAECAALRNSFWQANDYLYAEARTLHARSNAEIAHDLRLDGPALDQCLREEGPRRVTLDVEAGDRLQIQGTPTLVVEGKTYLGNLPPWVLGRLQSAASGVDSGTTGP